MSVPERAMIVAARRTAVCPRGGALAHLQADELAVPVFTQLLDDAGIRPDRVDHVLLGNALYGGGNPARMAALRAGFPVSTPAMTVDTQCCSGLDAILQGVRLIEAGAADCVLAGGAESFSRSPIRMHRPTSSDDEPVPYDRPAFAPPAYADPDLAEAAACLAETYSITREAQADFAVTSHQKARAGQELFSERLVAPDSIAPRRDGFIRHLSRETALRAPILAGTRATGLNAATIACEADGAGAVLLLSETVCNKLANEGLRVRAGRSQGGDPNDPALVPVAAARSLLADERLTARDLSVVELMEAYAVQAMVTVSQLELNLERTNLLGGALSRGHPIGASGAILAVQIFEAMKAKESAAEGGPCLGLALIAAAGGLGTAMLFERCKHEVG